MTGILIRKLTHQAKHPVVAAACREGKFSFPLLGTAANLTEANHSPLDRTLRGLVRNQNPTGANAVASARCHPFRLAPWGRT